MTENAELKQRLADAEKKILFYETHKTLFEGVRGETLVARLVEGVITAYAESHDVEVTGGDGSRIEVKMASLNVPVKGSSTLRWAWSNIFGESGQKEYDWLVLIGKKDERYLDRYPDRECPFVFFAIPRREAEEFTVATGRTRSIFLTTNPNTSRSKAGILYERYMLTQEELRTRLGL